MRTSALFDAKYLRIFRNLWCVRTDKGVEPVRTFAEKGGGGQFFAILCWRLLWTAPYASLLNKPDEVFIYACEAWSCS